MRLGRPLAIRNANIPRKIKEKLYRRKINKYYDKLKGININQGIKVTS